MKTSKRRLPSLPLAVFALVAALAWSLPGAVRANEPPTAELDSGGFCTAGVPPSLEEGIPAPVPAQTCGPCLLEFCAQFKVRCTFSECGPNNECCEYICSCDQTCQSGGVPGNVCPLSIPDDCIVCGNEECEPSEDCESCPEDCESKTTGKPSGRFCCGNGVMEEAEGDGTICDGNF